ncbi:MAG: sugar ABC transporter substrate-binding protein, partial [Lachnospiraceae bacterium]|nr:sugar ABC transporter substrate-binding protein [Lachnospiraceae bacterium]
MTLKKRITMILVIALCVGGIYGVGRLGIAMRQGEETETVEESLFGRRETLYLWYTDETLTDYLNSVAVSYS